MARYTLDHPALGPVPSCCLAQDTTRAPACARVNLMQWLNRLDDYLPAAYISVNLQRLVELYGERLSPHAAAIYCQAFGLPAHAPAIG